MITSAEQQANRLSGSSMELGVAHREGYDRTNARKAMDKIGLWGTLSALKQNFAVNQLAVAKQMKEGLGPDAMVDFSELAKLLDTAPFGNQILIMENPGQQPEQPQQPQPPTSGDKPDNPGTGGGIKTVPEEPKTPPVPPPTPPVRPVQPQPQPVQPAQPQQPSLATRLVGPGLLVAGAGLGGLAASLANRPTPPPTPPPAHVEPIEIEGQLEWESSRAGSSYTGSVGSNRSRSENGR